MTVIGPAGGGAILSAALAVFYSAHLSRHSDGTHKMALIKQTTHTKETKKQTNIKTKQEHAIWPDSC
jgi:hypothetical protein